MKTLREMMNLIESAQQGVAEGAKWRKYPDAYHVDDEGNKTPRNPNSSKFGYDPLQRRSDTANDAKTPRGKTAALKTSLKMANGNQGVAEGHADQQRKIVKKAGKPVGEVGIDRESSPGVGQWYMKHYASGKDLSGYDSMEEALEELKYIIKQGLAEEQLEETTPDALAKIDELTRK